MYSVFVNCFILILLRTKILAYPSDYKSLVVLPLETVQDHVEMGKNLERIPPGRASTRILNLAYNHISSLTSFVFQNNSYQNLTKILLYQNKINSIDLTAFRGLKHLKTIDLSDNNVTMLDPYVLRYNTELKKLDLSQNRINFGRLQVFLVSSSLETLVLAQNNIDQIYELTFMGLSNLSNLVLDFNALFLISPNSFKPLGKLQYLSLANTGVYRLSESMFDDLPRIIDLQDTPLSKRFDPPLRKVMNNAVGSLINIDKYIFTSCCIN